MARVLGDLPYLHAALVVRDEDLEAARQGALDRLAALRGVEVAHLAKAVRDGTAEYGLTWPSARIRCAHSGQRGGAGGRSARRPLRTMREAAAAIR